MLFEIAQPLPSTMREKSGDHRADQLGARGCGLWAATIREGYVLQRTTNVCMKFKVSI